MSLTRVSVYVEEVFATQYVTQYLFIVVLVLFFFKQKTAYEMRISDWSSDVCSSDLRACVFGDEGVARGAQPCPEDALVSQGWPPAPSIFVTPDSFRGPMCLGRQRSWRVGCRNQSGMTRKGIASRRSEVVGPP